MKVYVFEGHRGDFRGRTLAKGDRMELTTEDADYLIVGQNFPIAELVEKIEKDEVKDNVTV